jgi:hypothetical protein
MFVVIREKWEHQVLWAHRVYKDMKENLVSMTLIWMKQGDLAL